MAASDYDFSSTRAKVFKRAFRILRVVDPRGELDGFQTDQALEALQAMLKAWQAKKVFLWTVKSFSTTFTGGAASKALSSVNDGHLKWVDKVSVTSNGNEIFLEALSLEKYNTLSDKTEQSELPTKFSQDYSSSPTLYLHPVPSANVSGTIYGIVKLKDWDTSSSFGDFPIEWINAITFGLAEQLMLEYPIEPKKKAEIQYYANLYFTEARSKSEYDDNPVVVGTYDG